jgi:GLPGLI family protein
MPMSQYMKEVAKDMGEAAWKSNLAREYRETLTHMPTVWINQPEGETTSRDAIFPGMFEGYEPTPQMDWILTADTMHISGYVCSRAEITFKGVKWNVWYTEEVPSSAGPWRLRGLPGLIVKAEGNAHTFTLAELRQESTPITYASSVEIERMKHGKWVKYRKSILGSRLYPKNPVHHIDDVSKYLHAVYVIKDGSSNHVLANNMYLLQKAHVYQPLELE